MLSINKIIKLNELTSLIVYYINTTSSYDAVIINNSLLTTNTGSQSSITNYVIQTQNNRIVKKRTEIITLEFDYKFYDSISRWCSSLNITFEQLLYAFIEFIVSDKSKSWISLLANKEKYL